MSERGKIYTRFGDRGRTKLLSGETVGKDDLRVSTYGALDELQSHLGFARAVSTVPSIRSVVEELQGDLFVAGAELASAPAGLPRLKRRLRETDIEKLEARIDRFTGEYGLPKGFVVPGDSVQSAALHVARSVCRRAERLLVSLDGRTGGYGKLITYFNRLSDLLFVLAWAATVAFAVEGVLSSLEPRGR